MATVYVFTGNTYSYRRLFRDHKGEFFYRPNRWEVPADSQGNIPQPLRNLPGIEVERIVTVDTPPQGPTAPPTRGTPTRPSNGRQPTREDMEDIGENRQEPIIDDGVSVEPHEEDINRCPF